MQAVVYLALALVVLAPVIGILIGMQLRKKAQTSLARTTAYVQRQGWQQAPPDRRIGQRSWLLYQATGSAELRIQGQYSGEHRGLPFQAAQVVRPPRPGRRSTFQRLAVVYAPRPVPGPRLQLAKRGLSTATFLARHTPIGDPGFESVFHVSTEDAGFARAVLHPGLAGALPQDTRAQQSVVAFESEYLFAMQHGELTPQSLQSMLDLLADIHSSVP